ncbi:MAG: pyruvate, phosphate dikinase [Acidobacteria bacterium RBG_16_64_8]|nr:MAG: pyruvate, phosphate dikinase [Acidobacteria bacterium RBG_16_64_8]
MTARKSLSTGLQSLDQVIRGVLPGDNIVWQTDDIEDYAVFVEPFVAHALRRKRTLVYFRFARHRDLIRDGAAAEIHRLSPALGFETFTAEIHKVIEAAGRGAFYVFDCLSDLAADWHSDLMLGNFFRVTCPYLYDLETITYFGLFRDSHSIEAVAAIRGTTQLLLDVFRHDGRLHVHPLKVDHRHSPTMYLPHAWEEAVFRPVTESAVLADILVRISERRRDAVARRLDIWDRRFIEAREVLEAVTSGVRPAADAADMFRRLLRMTVTREERLIALASRYLDLSDILAIRKRMIGTGPIGGKAAGMLLGRAVLCKTDSRWVERLETHDSFFIGSDVFYTFLVRNDCWRVRRNQRNPASFLDGAEEAREQILAGTFPPAIVEQFVAMLEYFGQSPIIVRSSSLLEDGFGNAFTGKYESVFCPNQGSPEERLAAFLSAVRTVYASTMSKEALLYRAHRGLLESDEQMAILVQRVSGAVYGDLFYPQAAGVGLSYNPYVWNECIDPEAGMLRLVFGLGTRAVNRSDDDYTRIVALNAPERRPEANLDEVTEYAQRRVDVLDLEANCFRSLPSDEVISGSAELPIDMFASRKHRPESRRGGKRVPDAVHWVLTFDRLLAATEFVRDMREMLRVLQDAYEYPVDTEFTVNFLSDGSFRINLVQCRPLQVREGGRIVAPPDRIRPADLVIEVRGTIVGPSSLCIVDRLIYVVPAAYRELNVSDRYSVARMIGRLAHLPGEEEKQTLMLIGPGRWGTSTPSLGVPVSFAEIDTVSILCEIVAMDDRVVPDVSLGTHFFNDLVEANMLYMALFPGREGNHLNETFFARQRNRLVEVLPEAAPWSDVVRVIDVSATSGRKALYINANCFGQRALCYLASVSGP